MQEKVFGGRGGVVFVKFTGRKLGSFAVCLVFTILMSVLSVIF